jgi:hypothetical protein
MAFDLKSFAVQVRPSGRRSSPEPFSKSIFDAGSPQYIRPEDLCLDIQSALFNINRKSKQELGDLDPSDFHARWSLQAAKALPLQRVGTVSNQNLGNSVMSLLRCPKRQKQNHPTLNPIIPELALYKNIGPKLPNFLSDQLRPALCFADNIHFSQRMQKLRTCLHPGTHFDDSLKQLALAFLPPVSGRMFQTIPTSLAPHDGPLVKDFISTPSRRISVCKSLNDTIDSLINLEPLLPRIIWIRWLTSTFRLWLPLVFLKRCTVTNAAARIIKRVLFSNSVPPPVEISQDLIGGNALLRGSKEWLNQLTPIIQNYVRSRFEISILLELSNLHERLAALGINPADPDQKEKLDCELSLYEVASAGSSFNTLPAAQGLFSSSKISMPGDSGPNRLPFDAWLSWIVANRASLEAIAKSIGGDDIQNLIERVYSFVRPEYEPLKNGFSKNMREFVVYNLGAPLKADRDPEYPDELNLLYRSEGGRGGRQIMIQPGPELLGMLVQIVSHQAKTMCKTSAKLSDLLDLFDAIGIDFRSNPEDFENLKNDLLKHGLLQSSADAAEAASLKPVYSF